MNMYGESQPCEHLPASISQGRQSSDELKYCSPPIKRHCSNDILSESETNIVGYDEQFIINKSSLQLDEAGSSSLPSECKVLPTSPMKSSATTPLSSPLRSSPVKSMKSSATTPLSSPLRSSPVKLSTRSSNKENNACNHNSPVSPSDGTNCDDQVQSRDDSSSKSPVKKRNIFAVSSNAGLRPRFSLNESKVSKNEVETRVEVRSRYFHFFISICYNLYLIYVFQAGVNKYITTRVTMFIVHGF